MYRTDTRPVAVPELSPHPSDSEQLGANLAMAVLDWQADHLNVDKIKAMRSIALDYAGAIRDVYPSVPELFAGADRLRYSAENDRPSVTVARHAADLLDAVAQHQEDEYADRAMLAHDAWRGERYALDALGMR